MTASYFTERHVDIRAATPYSASRILVRQFVDFKYKRPFSAIVFDHAHEHTHAVIKSDGGAIGITDDASALRR